MKLETYEKAKELQESIEKLKKVKLSNSIALIGLDKEGKYTCEARGNSINEILKDGVDKMISKLEKEFDYLQDSTVDRYDVLPF